MPSNAIVILTNCGSRKQARGIGRSLVEGGLAACVNTVSAPVESIYRWKGKLETAREFMLLIKTTRARYAAVERTIHELHSYEVPEIIAIPIAAGSRDYLSWLASSVEGVSKNQTSRRIKNLRARVRKSLKSIEAGESSTYQGREGLAKLTAQVKYKGRKLLARQPSGR